nr:alkaline shock response membrane anchor protein AmaP [Ardenticatena sp.]
MNTLNRFLAIVTLLGFIVCALVMALGVWALQVGPVVDFVRQWMSDFILLLAQLPTSQRATMSGVFLMLGLVAFILLVLDLRPNTSQEVLLPVRSTEGGETVVSSNAVVRRLTFAIDQLDDVVDVEPQVKPKGDGAEVYLAVRTRPNIDVPMKDAEIKQVARQVLEEQIGLKVKKLVVNIDHSPFEEQM